MTRPRIATSKEEAWDAGIYLDPPPRLNAVSAPGGLLIGGGERLYMLRPGAEGFKMRDAPFQRGGEILVVAAEPRPPWRYAIANDAQVVLFFYDKKSKVDANVHLTPPEDAGRATHMAWAKEGDVTVLYIRWENGSLVRTRRDMTGIEEVDLPWVDALASDATGNLALTHFATDRCRVYRSADGHEMTLEEFDLHADPEAYMHVAVAGQAVALAVEREGAFLSRGPGLPFEKCEALATAGPLAFEGTASDAALFGATEAATYGAILRVDRDGTAFEVTQFGSDAGDVPAITSLSWDATRERLWIASPAMGLSACTAPAAKRGKKAPLS